jgi:hypothetical protein
MDIIATLIARVEEYRATNKQPCKNYATQAAAQAATGKVALMAAQYFYKYPNKQDCQPARYVVFYVPAWGRWVGALDYTELLSRPSSTGGFLGIAKGWYTY